MTKELLAKICDVFKLEGEYFVTYEHGWTSPDTGEWFYLFVRGTLFPDQLDSLRELVYVSDISLFRGCITITCRVGKEGEFVQHFDID